MAIPALGDLDRLSHAYLITAPSREESMQAARTIAQAALCVGAHPPCSQCRPCRKVLSGIHPDVITVSRPLDDKGREKREISVDQIRGIISDASILPNEADRKIYIIDQADTMNSAAQNASLKLLEEPPKGVIFLLCAVNAQLLLPTVRSRCVEINCNGQGEREDEESGKLARDEHIKRRLVRRLHRLRRRPPLRYALSAPRGSRPFTRAAFGDAQAHGARGRVSQSKHGS